MLSGLRHIGKLINCRYTNIYICQCFFFLFYFLCSTFAREQRSGKIYAFGLNNYNQIGIKKKGELVFVPTITTFEDVISIAGNFFNMFFQLCQNFYNNNTTYVTNFEYHGKSISILSKMRVNRIFVRNNISCLKYRSQCK